MSAYYRKERYRKTASFKESIIKTVLALVFVSASVATSFHLWNKTTSLKDNLVEQKRLVQSQQNELDILRTLNPYHVESNEVLAKAVENADLYPGWITRVYPLPDKKEQIFYATDIGSFVMNETRFSLSSHERYGITEADSSMYRLNGLFPSHQPGRLQVAVAFYLKGAPENTKVDVMSQIGSCYARIDINRKRVIDHKLHVVTKYEQKQILTGNVDLDMGLYPISAVFYCDKNSDFKGDNVEVAISFRNPRQQSLTTSRYSIFHIYKPDNITAKL
ncbi:hypothetical protein LP316_14190 [Thalassotalea sp. LPB0316]|uniref:hypothetical protein n=1 Tax=Thalassotalea sp. LPB0316 TaxID=2769490 RepID=UPI0018674A7E|nr:hypothetical protein [Thalassotalea sp. LPB0316]QOL25429.1 hypothetical protein LP316_14190 [Thalassotalea sp. LPB0316]